MNEHEKQSQEPQEEPGAARSSLGKEAKIGVAFILVLAIILGVVVARRVMGPKPPEAVAQADGTDKDRDEGKVKPPHDGPGESPNRDDKPKPPATGREVVVQGQKALNKPMKPNEANLWKIPSDKSDSKPALGAAVPPAAPPPFGASASLKPNARSPNEPPPMPPMAELGKRGGANPLGLRDADRLEHRPRPDNVLAIGNPDQPQRRDGEPDRGNRLRLGNEEPRGRIGEDRNRLASNEPPSDAAILGAPMPPDGSRHGDPRLPRSERPGELNMAEHNRPEGPPGPPRQYGNSLDGREMPTMNSYGRNDLRDPPPQPRHRPPTQRREDGKYEIQPSDSYWTISERLYGSGSYYKALAEHNRAQIASEDQLKPGDVIDAPPLAQLEQTYPSLCPKPERRESLQSRTQPVSTRSSRGGRAYTVTEGDTLFNIARYELGKASRWAEIYELNRDVLGKDFNYLTPGMQLTLPQDENSDLQARRSANQPR